MDPHYLDADPDPARHFDADPNLDPTCHFDTRDLDPSFQLKAQNLKTRREGQMKADPSGPCKPRKAYGSGFNRSGSAIMQTQKIK